MASARGYRAADGGRCKTYAGFPQTTRTSSSYHSSSAGGLSSCTSLSFPSSYFSVPYNAVTATMSPSTPSAPEHFSPRPSIDSLDFEAGIHEVDSSSALILVPDHSDHDEINGEDPAAFDFVTSSDEDESPDGESQDNLFERGSAGSYSSVPALSSLSVFLYLLSPLLKLGALLSPSAGVQGLKISLPALFLFACLCALTRQIWYMLARYVRRADMEEIVLQAFARGAGRGRDGERKRRWIRRLVHLCTGTLRVLLIALYLRGMSTSRICRCIQTDIPLHQLPPTP